MRSFHPTFISHHIVIIQTRLTLINQLTICGNSAGVKAVVNYDNPKLVHILNVSFLTILIDFGVLLYKSVLHLLKFSVFKYTGTVADTARRICSLQRFGTISTFSCKISPLNSGPSFLSQTNIVASRGPYKKLNFDAYCL